ncbi:MAG: bifunctional (p)ppGpp synthetase/guanosine-3',5'-bis(diphosphate) 3'-pyrophosphohydrolase [Saprospiraceae bacterium]|nr:bifunctional (p)ppGpp synthetase/guanosine-3',5'-bis(diphosphate) 3'-pyrophosphohydrolase [Saprospiraceae bacterium]
MSTQTATYNTEDKQLIQQAYRQLLNSIKSKMDDRDRKHIREAYELAVVAHSKQRRKSGEPYILHPIEVARICAEEIGLGPTAIVAAILHDVVEDTEITSVKIHEQFGEKIGMIVDGLTKLDGLYEVESPQAENFKKVLQSLLVDVRVVLIKMADRLHNMRTLGSMPRHKQLKIAAETDFIYAPLAHRLGLYNLKTEFEDLIMKIKEPAIYTEISNQLQESKDQREEFIDSFIDPLSEELSVIPFPTRIFGRPKSIYSIWNKIKTKKVPFEEIYDLFAVRIIITAPLEKEKQACWQVYSIVTDVHIPIPERLKDWVTTPKSNGYESLHTTVIGPKGKYVEVQIRSERMDDIAERGFAAHWKYKGQRTQGNVYNNWLDNVREILENDDEDAIQFLNDFKTNLFQEEVYVYTPKGDMRVLPKGATALDFAFHIHSDVGYHCASLKVNNKLVPMGYKLKNGDQVTVITKESQRPSEAWLKMVVTGKARSKIRSSMKEERRKQGEFGMEALQRKLRNLKVDWEENVDTLVQYFGFNSRPDLYFAISVEQVNLSDLKEHFNVEGHKLVPVPKVQEVIEEASAPRGKRKKKYTGQPKLMIDGTVDQYEYQLGTCCSPVQGDDVFAYNSATGGLKIHRTSCPNATNLMARFGYRILRAEWIMGANTSFVADLLITGVDSGPGVIQTLSNQISSTLGLNIRSFYIDGHEGFFEGRVSLLVTNKDQLNIVIRVLKNLEGVSNVTRIEA